MSGKGKFRKDGYFYDGDMTENKRNGQGYEEW